MTCFIKGLFEIFQMTNYEIDYYNNQIKKQEMILSKAEESIQTYKKKLCLSKQKLAFKNCPIDKLQNLPNDVLIIIWKNTLYDFLYMKNFDKIDELISTIGFKKCRFDIVLIESKEYQSHCISKKYDSYYTKAYHLFSTKTKKEYMKGFICYTGYYDYFILFGNDKSIKNRYKFMKRVADDTNIKNNWKKICDVIDYQVNE